MYIKKLQKYIIYYFRDCIHSYSNRHTSFGGGNRQLQRLSSTLVKFLQLESDKRGEEAGSSP